MAAVLVRHNGPQCRVPHSESSAVCQGPKIHHRARRYGAMSSRSAALCIPSFQVLCNRLIVKRITPLFSLQATSTFWQTSASFKWCAQPQILHRFLEYHLGFDRHEEFTARIVSDVWLIFTVIAFQLEGIQDDMASVRGIIFLTGLFVRHLLDQICPPCPKNKIRGVC